MIFSARNLTERTVAPCLPWEFVQTADITLQIRHDKEDRQYWYQTQETRHSFYTTIEAANPNQRASREDNPPKALHGIVADFDIKLEEAKIDEAVAAMPLKPSWVERSLGGNARLVWLFPKPLPVESYDFCVALLQASQAWLKMDLLAGLDGPALSDPARLFCNGCVWRETGHGPINEAALQAFFVETGKKFRFVSGDGVEIPLDRIEKGLREKFPHFCWPSDFVPESSGPSFWIPASQSSNSAILKPDGFFSFSAHAEKPFYSWADILGTEFVKEFIVASISKATDDLWFDGKKFYRRKSGQYVGLEMAELQNFLEVDCGLTQKSGRIKSALSHIYNNSHVDSAGPFIFRPSGLITYQGKRKLNTASAQVTPPATGTQAWGPLGNFPFLSRLLENIFTSEFQRDHFLSWFSYFYTSGLNSAPMPGQVIVAMGGVAVGKTLVSREVVGRAVGGYCDASGYLIRAEAFNAHMFEAALWVLDDETVSDSPTAAQNVQIALKKAAANSSFMSNRKFQQQGMVAWEGRVFATTNLDHVSSRLLGPLADSTADKISLYRCQSIAKFKFPSRTETEKLISAELPYLLRFLTDYEFPEHVERDTRFGIKAHHEESLVSQAHQTSKSAPFREILIEALEEFFKDNPEAVEWRGTVSRLIMQIHMNPMREHVVRTLRLEAVSRYLEAIEKDGTLHCCTEQGALNTRTWIFRRFGDVPPQVETPEVAPQQPSIFDK